MERRSGNRRCEQYAAISGGATGNIKTD